MAQRKALLPALLLLTFVWSQWSSFVNVPLKPDLSRTSVSGGRAQPTRSAVALSATGDEAEESIDVGGFSALVVGLAILPFVGYALSTASSIVFSGAGLEFGPFGLQLTSVFITFGLVLWSLSSVFSRGKGLPAGWLGLLGLAEGLSYLAALSLLVAAAVSSFRSPSSPSPSKSQAPSFRSTSGYSASSGRGDLFNFDTGSIKAPDIKMPSVPSFKAPEMPAVPSFKAPTMPAVPSFKAPDIKVPDIKVPDIKVPDITPPKLPTITAPDVKIPQTTPKAPAKQQPLAEDFDDLFGSTPPAPAKPAPEAEKRKAEEARKEAKKAEEEKKAAEARKREEAKKAEEERKAEEARKREEAKKAEEERKAEEARKREEAKKAEEERKAAEARKREETTRKVEEERRAEEARKREEAKKTEVPVSKPAEAVPDPSKLLGSALADLGRLGKETKPDSAPQPEKKVAPTTPTVNFDLFDL